jgi:hypothetical protein
MVDAYATSFTATITLLNLTDDQVIVDVTIIDPSTDEAAPLGNYEVGPSGQTSNSVPPATYRLEFREPIGSAGGPTCTIAIKDGETVTFVAIPGAIAVSRTGFAPIDAVDLFVATSSLCRS